MSGNSQDSKIPVAIARMPGAEDLPLPRYMSAGAAGLDLPAAVEGEKILQPGEFAKIPTGFAIALPEGYEAQVRPRSGLAARHGVTLLNAPGTVDSDYRGEIAVILINHGSEPFAVNRGDRIAQLVISPVLQGDLEEVSKLAETRRGPGGFGHTGK
jgi:dUTP pyrophosphatase